MPSAATITRTHKTCTKCGVAKPLDEYHRDKNMRDGRRTYCKTCKAADSLRYREANREKIAKRDRRYREANHEKITEQNRRYREENREEIIEKAAGRKRRYCEKHRDYVNQQNRENKRDNQRLSLYAAHRRHHPWTPDDDDMVLNSPMTVFQIAVALNKTYNQVRSRRDTLRKNLTTTR